MKKDVLIEINSCQTADGESDTVQLTTTGSYARRNGCYYIIYDESLSEGSEGVMTTLKVEGSDRVTILRSGAAGSNLYLEKGRRHLCHYGTPFGDLMIGVCARRIQTSLNERGGRLSLSYTIDVNSGVASENEVEITVREAAEPCPN